MSDTELLPCRHREELPAGVWRCHSPKLVGLGYVTPSTCQSCYCRDHEIEPETQAPPRLRACAYLGLPLADTPNTFACHHPAHAQTSLLGCRSCPDYLYPVLTPDTPADDVRKHLELAPRPQPEGWWNLPQTQSAYAEAADDFLRQLPPYPMGRFQGRGVVIVGGGKYFPSVYVTVRALRHVGCQLPIRVYYFGNSSEMPCAWQALLAPYDVAFADLDDPAIGFAFPPGHEPTFMTERGWVGKMRAILDAPFEEVLFLDADCYPCRDPGFLFDLPSYQETGAIFWHDIVDDPTLWWEAFGLKRGKGSSIESGQLVVHKRTCWAPVQLGWWYACHHAATFRWGYGDKHACFEVPWAKLGRPYTSFSASGDWSMVAYRHVGPDGAPLLIHRIRDKFRFPGAIDWMTPQSLGSNIFHRALPLEVEAFAWMSELAQTLGVHQGVLNLGCGYRPLFGAHNHDGAKHAPYVDIAHDLNEVPWPWPAGAFAEIVADHVLGYLNDVAAFMREAHRVLKPRGRLRLRAPHYLSKTAHLDPGLQWVFRPTALDHFTQPPEGADAAGANLWRMDNQGEEDNLTGRHLVWQLTALALTERA